MTDLQSKVELEKTHREQQLADFESSLVSIDFIDSPVDALPWILQIDDNIIAAHAFMLVCTALENHHRQFSQGETYLKACKPLTAKLFKKRPQIFEHFNQNKETSPEVLWGMTNDLNIIECISQHLDPEQIPGVFSCLMKLADGSKTRRNKIWTQFAPLVIQYPGKFLLIGSTRFVDGPITEHYWQSSDAQGPSFCLVQWISLLKSDFDHYITKLDEAFKQHPERKALLNFENNKYADPFDDITPAVLLRLVE
ncbi:MAG: hypothetical protein MJK04_09570, partial [Psychrosphaera sp.]|nr:hypothetical protein [Psychrosphaera sp.]